MNDFLQSIRNNSKDKRYNKNRRSYDGNNGYNHHAGENKRNGNEKRNKNYRGNTAFDSITNETMMAVKSVLTELVGTQKQSIEVEKRRAAAEERKAEALESIAVYVKNLAGNGPASAENHTKRPAATPSAAEETAHQVAGHDSHALCTDIAAQRVDPQVALGRLERRGIEAEHQLGPRDGRRNGEGALGIADGVHVHQVRRLLRVDDRRLNYTGSSGVPDRQTDLAGHVLERIVAA